MDISDTNQFVVFFENVSLYGRFFNAHFRLYYLRNIFTAFLILLVLVARTKLNSKKSLESFLSLSSIFGYLGKETKNTSEHVIMNKILIYARPCVNKEFVHSCQITHKGLKRVTLICLLCPMLVIVHFRKYHIWNEKKR